MFGAWRSAPSAEFHFQPDWIRAIRAGIHIGEGTAINLGACILTHDTPRGVHADTWIGKDCNIGANSLIMPGIRVGDNCVVAAASVVMKDVPSNSLVAGNPARIMEKGIKTRRLGIIDRTVRPDFGASPSVPDEAAPEKAAS
jgi:acetyltransferase-like isoleucine patch superfamily enzyme